VGFVLIEQ